MVIGIEEEQENEKEGTVVGVVNNGGEDKEGEKEKKKDDKSSSGPVGRHFRTKAEACEFLADLRHYPVLANWLAGDALEAEARRLRRNGEKKRKGLQFQVAEGAQGSNHLREVVFKSEVAEVQQILVAEGSQGSNELQTAVVLKSEDADADAQQQKVAEGARGSKHLQTNADLESEDIEVQQQTVPEGAQGNKRLQTDAFLESEDSKVQQQKVDDTGKGDNGNTSSFQDITKPTNHGDVQEDSASTIDLCFSCAEKVEVTVDATIEEANMNAEKDDFIDLSEKGEQAEIDADLERRISWEADLEKDADLERTISLEADRKDIIPKLLDLQVEKDADVERISLEAQPTDKKHIIPVKLIKPPKYFDLQDNSEQTSSSSGEDDDNCRQQKKHKQKVCCICGRLGHHRTECKKVNKSLFCRKKGHLAKDCPHEDIVREQTSNFCLKCGNSGHDIFSCTNDYPADDLEKIQCYVCKAFGHLCCANYGNEGSKSLSCYNCGEPDHLGPECKKVQEKSSRSKRRNGQKKRKKLRESTGPPAVLAHPNSGENRHSKQECDEKAKEMSEPVLASIPNVPKLAKLPQPKLTLPYKIVHGHQNYYVPRFEPPYKYGGGPQNYIPRYNPPHMQSFAPSQGWSQWREALIIPGNKDHVLDHTGPMFGSHQI